MLKVTSFAQKRLKLVGATFLEFKQSQRERGQGATPFRGRAIRRYRNQGKLFMLGPNNELASLARMASGGGIYAGSEELNFND